MSKVIRFAVSALLLAVIGWKTDWHAVGAAFENLRIDLWIAAVGLLLLAQLASAWRWQVFARELRFPASKRQLLGYYLIGMYFNLLLPTSVGGDVVRAWYLDGGSGRRLAAFAAVFLDRLNGLLVLIALACGAVMLSPLALPFWIQATVWGIAACAALGLTALLFARRLHWLPFHRQQQLQTMVHALRARKPLIYATLLSVFVQAANVVIVWLIGIALDAPIPAAYYWVFVPMVSLLTLLPVSINGMGVREGGIALFLAHLPQVEPATGLTLSFLWFAVYGAVSLLGGAVYLAGAFPKPGTSSQGSNPGESAHGPIGRDSDQGREGQLDQAA